ncbi:hypothetical protein MPH_08354 [Macrophomina phaseolina MS6]|uniref:Uncharacterized protein n=1 Tax=Macrophomina phaseolina (strain MS6) TaxID=1126212 RepID=K2SCC3_MACPH|nr:hypothetical protein MPH_08354 [Macrophomina phaseolina MS6]
MELNELLLETEWMNPVEVPPLPSWHNSWTSRLIRIHRRLYSLQKLFVAILGIFKTSDPRDVLYAPLSTSKDRPIEPDPAIDVFQTSTGFVETVVVQPDQWQSSAVIGSLPFSNPTASMSPMIPRARRRSYVRCGCENRITRSSTSNHSGLAKLGDAIHIPSLACPAQIFTPHLPVEELKFVWG